MSNKTKKRVKKHHHFAAQAVIVVVISVFVTAANVLPNSSGDGGRGNFGGYVANITVDEVASAQVAKQIAQSTNLLIADNITNLADSLEARVDFATTNESYIRKPQVISTDARTRQDIIKYVAKEGDSISDLARRFGVTSDSIRWANDITGDSVTIGDELRIPPVSGIIYEVEDGDTAEDLADYYSANARQITSFNDAELSGLVAGTTIIIPDGEKPAPVVTPTVFASSTTPAFLAYGGNGYSYGYCTWHVANRRAAIGRPIPRNLGNANTWASIASAGGLQVEDAPIAGAVLWHRNTGIAGGYGHVGFVESINPDGSAVISDMNYGGWNVITYRTISPAEFAQYRFIY